MSDGSGYNPREVTGFSHEELAIAFDRVRNSRDWRAPIRAEVPAEMQTVVAEAISWFTATAPTFEPADRPNYLMATAPGYLRGPWGTAERPPSDGTTTAPS